MLRRDYQNLPTTETFSWNIISKNSENSWRVRDEVLGKVGVESLFTFCRLSDHRIRVWTSGSGPGTTEPSAPRRPLRSILLASPQYVLQNFCSLCWGLSLEYLRWFCLHRKFNWAFDHSMSCSSHFFRRSKQRDTFQPDPMPVIHWFLSGFKREHCLICF
jgi:hypothetical protein